MKYFPLHLSKTYLTKRDPQKEIGISEISSFYAATLLVFYELCALPVFFHCDNQIISVWQNNGSLI